MGESASGEFRFRHITALFDFQIDGADSFVHSGQAQGATYDITILRCDDFGAHLDQIAKYSDNGVRQQLIEHKINQWSMRPRARHCLLFDITHPVGSLTDDASQSPMFGSVHSAIMEALRFYSSAGVAWTRTYFYRYPPCHPGLLSWIEPTTTQVHPGHPGSPSVLRQSDFAACRQLFQLLLVRDWNDGTAFSNILNLAREYHRLAFTLENVAHAFLILMVIFEALFKRDETEKNASKAAQRISRLLGSTKTACMDIQTEFNDDPVNSFCKIRNRIAHGHPSLSVPIVTAKYPSLYRYVTQAILTLMFLPAGTIDHKKDYYDEIERTVQDRFNGLANI